MFSKAAIVRVYPKFPFDASPKQVLERVADLLFVVIRAVVPKAVFPHTHRLHGLFVEDLTKHGPN